MVALGQLGHTLGRLPIPYCFCVNHNARFALGSAQPIDFLQDQAKTLEYSVQQAPLPSAASSLEPLDLFMAPLGRPSP